MDYRREIDGLRALAVVPVILFHAGYKTFNGGFVGVDVFFVISGYLITTIILAELEQGRFSIANFYERRARRILPALFAAMLACLPFAWFWLMPGDLKDFSQSLVAVSLFASNILFWLKSGYFDTSTELKPLLHTWSLAVEEQYYVLFPLFLMLFWRLGKRWILAVLAVALAASLALAQWASLAKPDAAFYLLPTRGWELLIGALTAFYLARPDRREFGRGLCEAGGWAGLALISFSVLAYSSETPFPGLYALAPTLGTALIILFATQQTTIGRFVGNKAFVAIGLISYSAYIWHQPMFAFARHIAIFEPSHLVFALLSIASFVLAYFSWRFIESPFRSKKVFGRARIFQLALIGSLAFIAIGMAGHVFHARIDALREAQGFDFLPSERLLEEARASSPVYIAANRFDDGKCRFSVMNLDAEVARRLSACAAQMGPGVLIVGDSHATNFYHALVRNPSNERFGFLVGITKNGCHLPTEQRDCQYGEILDFLAGHPKTFSNILFEKAGYLMLELGMSREQLRNPDANIDVRVDDAVIAGVGAYLDKLARYAPVTWFGPRLEPLVTAKELQRRGCAHAFIPDQRHRLAFTNLDAHLADLSKGRNWRYVSQIEKTRLDFARDYGDCERLLWMDLSHFSKRGEELFGQRFGLAELIE